MGVHINPFTGKLDVVDSPSGEFTDLTLDAGTASAPSISFDGDPNTGIYSSGADQLALSTNGTGRLFVDASGNVGVNNASPSASLSVSGTSNDIAVFERNFSTTDPALVINNLSPNANAGSRVSFRNSGTERAYIEYQLGTGTTPSLRFGTNGSERLRITSAGLVGIGTSAPIARLHVSTSDRTLLRVTGDGINTASSSLVLETVNAGSNFRATGSFYYDATSQTEWFSGRPYNSSDAFSINRKTGVTSNAIGDATAQRANSLLLVDSAGRVGVGTTSPNDVLHVMESSASAAAATSVSVAQFERFGNAGITLSTSDSGDATIFFGDTASSTIGRVQYGHSDDSLRFWTNSIERARIDSSGRLLVGTSSDSGGALLQVNGDRIRVGTAKTPASATATGTAGEICWDADYVYVCTATNTWKRAAIATW